MRLSTEAIVASTIALIFAVLSLGAIAREQGGGSGRSTHNTYVATSSSSLGQVTPNGQDVLRFN